MADINFIVIEEIKVLQIGNSRTWLVTARTTNPVTMSIHYQCKKPRRTRRVKRLRGSPRQCGWIWTWVANRFQGPFETQPSYQHTYLIDNPDNCDCVWFFFTVVSPGSHNGYAVTPPAQICFGKEWTTGYAGLQRYFTDGPINFVGTPFDGDEPLGPRPDDGSWTITTNRRVRPPSTGDYTFRARIKFDTAYVAAVTIRLVSNTGTIIRDFDVTFPHDLPMPASFDIDSRVHLSGIRSYQLTFRTDNPTDTGHYLAGSSWWLEGPL